MATAWKNSGFFFFFQRSDFHMVVLLLIAVHALLMHVLTLLSEDEILLLRYIVSWLTIVKGDPKASFSIASTLRCWHSSFLRIAQLTLDPYLIMLSVKQGGTKYFFFFFFLSLWYDSTRDWTPVSQTIGKHSNHYANGPPRL